ncbi:hypothetical protein Tco_1496975, partial [Tanacetum coccineum]
ELFLFNSNYCISSVKKGSSQDERKFAIFFHLENNEISKEGLRVLRDSLGGTLFWRKYNAGTKVGQGIAGESFVEVTRNKKTFGVSEFGWNFILDHCIPAKMSTRGVEDMRFFVCSSSSSSLSKLMGVSFCWSFGLTGGS